MVQGKLKQNEQMGGNKMKKRRVLAAIMTATLALSLAGCGGSSGDSKSSGSSVSSVANADQPLCQVLP